MSRTLVSPLQQVLDAGLDLDNLPGLPEGPVIATNRFPGSIIVGTCSACFGPMLIPEMWAGTPEVHPKPTCADCGRSKKTVAKWGPVIEVE